MAVLALADALPDFGSGRPPPPLRRPEPVFAATEPSPPAPPPVETEEDRIARAVARAEAELAERLEREHEEKLAVERARHAEEMAATAAHLGEQAARTIDQRFAEMEQNVATLTSAVTARILGVALTEDLQKRAVTELARIVAEAMKDRDALRIRVRGTAFLCDALKAQLGDLSRQVDFVEASGFDLTAEIDESLFETRLAEWSEALAEVLS